MKGTCIYVDGGMGHYVPAKTVKKELEEKGLEMDIQEFFSLLDIEWLGKINKYFWRTMLKNSKLENKISSYNDKSNGMDLAVKYGIKHCSSILISYIERMHPDFFFTTHPYAGTVISEILKAKNIDIPVYYFATDVFSAPIAAICNSLRRFYISTEEGREIVIKMGMMPEKVVLSPFPLQQRVQDAERLTKKKARKKLQKMVARYSKAVKRKTKQKDSKLKVATEEKMPYIIKFIDNQDFTFQGVKPYEIEVEEQRKAEERAAKKD